MNGRGWRLQLPFATPRTATQTLKRCDSCFDEMHVDRVDFTNSSRCGFCGRPLPLGIAYIMRLDDQSELPMGPVCARKNATTADVPNFTRGVHSAGGKLEPSDSKRFTRSRNGHHAGRRGDIERQRAITYLRLRQEKMSDFLNVRHPLLEPILQRYRKGALTEDDVVHLVRLMTVVENRYPLLALNALQTAYAYHRLLVCAAENIENENKRQYLLGVDEYLRNNLRLTAAQIEGANRWLEHMGPVRLRRCGFW